VWGPVLGIERMDELLEQVSDKLVDVLRKKGEKWKMNDVRVASMLSPWTPVCYCFLLSITSFSLFLGIGMG
jgi:hypothetical protein